MGTVFQKTIYPAVRNSFHFPPKFPFEPAENAQSLCRNTKASTLNCSHCLGMEEHNTTNDCHKLCDIVDKFVVLRTVGYKTIKAGLFNIQWPVKKACLYKLNKIQLS